MTDLHSWCLTMLTGIATAPLVESNTRREMLTAALAPVTGGDIIANRLEDLAYTLSRTHRQSGVDIAIVDALTDAAALLADALACDTASVGLVAA